MFWSFFVLSVLCSKDLTACESQLLSAKAKLQGLQGFVTSSS